MRCGLLALALALAVCGCRDGHESSAPATRAAADSGAATDAAVSTSLRVYTFVTADWAERGGVPGTRICRDDMPSQCAVADEQGNVEFFDLPESSQQLLHIARAGYVDLLKHLVTPAHDRPGVLRDPFNPMIPNALWARWAEQAGVELEPDKGHVLFFVLRGSGGSVDLRPAAGKRVYFASMQDLDPALEHPGGTGYGLSFNVPPGAYDAVFSHPELRCMFGMETGWPGSTADSGGIVVKPGLVSFPAFGTCVPRQVTAPSTR